MPDFLYVIVSRKCIRRYNPDPLADEMLDKVLAKGENIRQAAGALS